MTWRNVRRFNICYSVYPKTLGVYICDAEDSNEAVRLCCTEIPNCKILKVTEVQGEDYKDKQDE
jgi:hypothetical protein